MIDEKKDTQPEPLLEEVEDKDLDEVSGGINPQPLPPGKPRVGE